MPTGRPIYLKCAKCKKQYDRWGLGSGRIIYEARAGNLVRTGRVRGQPKPYPSTLLGEAHEYKCLACGHVGWSKHPSIRNRPLENEK